MREKPGVVKFEPLLLEGVKMRCKVIVRGNEMRVEITEHNFYQTFTFYPSQESSIGSISARYWGGPGFKSRQWQEFFSENK